MPSVFTDSEAGEHRALCSLLQDEAEQGDEDKKQGPELQGTIHFREESPTPE